MGGDGGGAGVNPRSKAAEGDALTSEADGLSVAEAQEILTLKGLDITRGIIDAAVAYSRAGLFPELIPRLIDDEYRLRAQIQGVVDAKMSKISLSELRSEIHSDIDSLLLGRARLDDVMRNFSTLRIPRSTINELASALGEGKTWTVVPDLGTGDVNTLWITVLMNLYKRNGNSAGDHRRHIPSLTREIDLREFTGPRLLFTPARAKDNFLVRSALDHGNPPAGFAFASPRDEILIRTIEEHKPEKVDGTTTFPHHRITVPRMDGTGVVEERRVPCIYRYAAGRDVSLHFTSYPPDYAHEGAPRLVLQ